jgi:hypothetical protein
MNSKTAFILFVVILIYSTTAFTQNPVSLQGCVISETGEKTEFYTLILQSAIDSSTVAVEMFSDTVFRFAGIKPQTYILRLQDVQYLPYDTLITVVEGTNVLNAPLILKPATLGEIVVKASRPVLTYNHGNVTVDVANSYLKDEVSMAGIFGKLPGVIVNKGEISVFGKSGLQIYINGMQARTGDEYKSLQPGDIEKIEIIRNVGAKYDANVDVVIKIKTKKRREEKYHVLISNSLEMASYLSNSPGLSLYFSGNEKLSQYITLSNVLGKSRDRHKSQVYTYFDDYTYSNLRNDYDVYKYKNTGLFYSLNCSISKDAELGIQYSGRFSGFSEQVDGTRVYDDETTSQTVNLNSDEQSKTNMSIINLNYKQQVGTTGEVSVIADYMIRNNNETNDIKELATGWNAHSIIDSDNEGKVFSITPEYKITGKKFNYAGGLKYSYLNSNSTMEFRSSTDAVHTSEHLTGAYMTFGANLSFIDIKLGVRTEYTSSGIRSGDDGLDELNREYFYLIPNISLSVEPNGRLTLVTYYRRTLNRPNISSLRSTVTYRDSLFYVTGNPRLRPAITDILGFNAVFYKFDFTLEYKIFKNRITFDNIPDSENPNRTIQSYTNLKEKHNELTVGISRSFNHRIFTNMTSLYYNKQFNMSMPFRNNIISFNKPRYVFKTSGDITVFKNTSLNYAFFYNSGGDRDFTRWNKSYSCLDLTLAQYLMKKKLLFSFSVEDVFNKYKANRWTQYHNGNIVYMQDSDALDSRFAVFRIRYNWGVQKSIRQKRSDTDHISRL